MSNQYYPVEQTTYIDLQKVLQQRDMPKFVVDAIYEVTSTGYLRLGKFLKNLSTEDCKYLLNGLHDITTNKVSNKQKFSMIFVMVVAMGEGCPLVLPQEIQDYVLCLAAMTLAVVLMRDGAPIVCLFENYDMTGATSRKPFYISKDDPKYDPTKEKDKIK